jgi:adenine deaminase
MPTDKLAKTIDDAFEARDKIGPKTKGAVRKAVERGLKPEAALRALTVTPAEMFGASARLGTLVNFKLF